MDLKQLRKKAKGFTLIELMVVIVIIGILVAIALPNFISAQDRAKLASVKSNMHTFQTILETYSVDASGNYPKDHSDVYNSANSGNNKYWKDFKNPFTTKAGPSVATTASATVPSVLAVVGGSFETAGTTPTNGGLVGYFAIAPGGATGVYNGYAVYGGDKPALGGAAQSWIKDAQSGAFFTLSNN